MVTHMHRRTWATFSALRAFLSSHIMTNKDDDEYDDDDDDILIACCEVNQHLTLCLIGNGRDNVRLSSSLFIQQNESML